MTPKSNLTKGLLYASATAVSWGFLAIFLKVALNHIDAITLSWFRFVIALTVLVILLFVKDSKKLNLIKRPPKLAIIAGIALGFNYIGFITGIDKTTASNAQIFIQTGPILLALAGILIFKEKVSKIQILGFVIAICGFVLFFNEQLNNLLTENQGNYKLGSLYVVLSAVSWACYAILQKSMVVKYNPQSLNVIIFAAPCLMLLPFIDFEVFVQLNWQTWLIVIFLGVNTVVAYGCLAESFRYIEANKVAIIVTLNPIITIITMSILAYLEVQFINPEVISLVGIAGGLLVITGAILTVKRQSENPQQIEVAKQKK
ncbi:DMT family transporter [Reichenbachiella sp. MALMAid0571]|uniref:DMT family transporter n=1 Tax=Reichenbachiella sp. MALMAid0571 TaxID=3143939 RepID=UPI0032E01B51